MENIDIINDYRIETFYNNKTDESTFIPISVYIEGKEKQDNNFDMNVIHLMDGEKKVKTPQMQDYIKNWRIKQVVYRINRMASGNSIIKGVIEL